MRIRHMLTGSIFLLILFFLIVGINPTDDYPLETADSITDNPPQDYPLYSVPDKSGPVAMTPWELDQDFQQAFANCGATLELANFCTVLQDPLPGEETNVHVAARILKGTVVKPGQTFSQNAAIGPYSQSRGFQTGPVYVGNQLRSTTGGGVCKMSSTLYNVAILANLPIVERYPHSMPVPYVPLGQDATVCYGVKDLKFLNNTDFPILIWAEGMENRLYVAFYGQNPPPRVKWRHETIKQIETYKIFRSDYSAEAGSEKVIVAGMDGAIIRNWITIQDAGQGPITKNLGVDYYNPMPTVIERGMKPVAAQGDDPP